MPDDHTQKEVQSKIQNIILAILTVVITIIGTNWNNKLNDIRQDMNTLDTEMRRFREEQVVNTDRIINHEEDSEKLHKDQNERIRKLENK